MSVPSTHAGADVSGALPPTSPPEPAGGNEPSKQQGRPPPRRPYATGLLLIGGGVLWLLAILGVPLRWDLLLPAALVAVGGVMLATRGRSVGGLVWLGVALLIVSLVFVPSMRDISAEIGERSVGVDDLAGFEGEPSLAIGSLVIDLRDLELAAGEELRLGSEVGIGELRVLVPADIEVVGEARAGIGSVVGPDGSRGGLGVEVDLDDGADVTGGTLHLDVSVGIGQVIVRR